MEDEDTIQVGDTMLIRGSYSDIQVAKVTQVCKRYFVCGGYKWDLSSCSLGMYNQYGRGHGSWYVRVARKATDEDIACVEAGRKFRVVSGFAWPKNDQALIDEVYAAITKHEARQTETKKGT
jgi:hypothetical protein